MKKYYGVVLLFVLPFLANAQFVINKSGNWTDAVPATTPWQGGVPASTVSDDVTMMNTFNITVQGGDNITSGNMTTGNNNTLTVDPSGTLQLGDAGNMRTLTAGTNMTISVQDGGTIIIWGDLMVNNSLDIVIQGPTGKIIIKGNLIMAANAVLSVAGSLEVDGDFTGGANTSVLVSAGGAINVGGTLTVGPGSFFHASCSSGSAPTGTNCGTFHAHQCGPDPDSQAFCSTAGLPIELLFFKAQASVSSIGLSWATASELNFDYFTIEKSTDGKNFEEVTKVTGSGTSRARIDYSAIDEKPTTGLSYYRLTEVDLDRTIHRLKVIAVDFTGTRSLSVFPNPVVDGKVNFELNFVPENKVLVSIVDLRGVMVSQFELSKQSVTLPVQLNSGLYLVTMQSESVKTVCKLVVR